MVNHADTLDDTRRVVQRCCAWARHIKPSGAWGASVLAGDHLSRVYATSVRYPAAPPNMWDTHSWLRWFGVAWQRWRCCEAALSSHSYAVDNVYEETKISTYFLTI